MAIRQNQRLTVGQPELLTEDEVERVVDEFNALWLAPHSTEIPTPKTLLRPKKYKIAYVAYIV